MDDNRRPPTMKAPAQKRTTWREVLSIMSSAKILLALLVSSILTTGSLIIFTNSLVNVKISYKSLSTGEALQLNTDGDLNRISTTRDSTKDAMSKALTPSIPVTTTTAQTTALITEAVKIEVALVPLRSLIRAHEVNLTVEASLIEKRKREGYPELPATFLKNYKRSPITEGYTLRPHAVENSTVHHLMIFFVKSACGRKYQRNNVRRTWGSVRQINGRLFGVVFLVGQAGSETAQGALVEENRVHGDLLQGGDIPDGYRSLPDKVLSGYQWVHYHAKDKADFYGFTDDDCMINLARTYDYFVSNQEQFAKSGTVYCGFIMDSIAVPIRKGKYGVSAELWPSNKYPPFCHGGMSVLPRAMVSDLYLVSEVTNRSGFHLEDVYISGILREKLGRGHNNVREISGAGSKRTFDYYMGVFSWHLSPRSSLFRLVWKIIYNLMDVVTSDGVLHKGYWPSAKSLRAKADKYAEVPSRKNIDRYFRKYFATFRTVINATPSTSFHNGNMSTAR